MKIKTKSEKVIVRMLIRRIKNLQQDIEECNRALLAYAYCWKLLQEHQFETVCFIDKALRSFDKERYYYMDKYNCDISKLKNVPIFSLTQVPNLDLDSSNNISIVIDIVRQRWDMIVHVSSDERMRRDWVAVEDFFGMLEGVDDLLIAQAWSAILVEQVHKS